MHFVIQLLTFLHLVNTHEIEIGLFCTKSAYNYNDTRGYYFPMPMVMCQSLIVIIIFTALIKWCLVLMFVFYLNTEYSIFYVIICRGHAQCKFCVNIAFF